MCSELHSEDLQSYGYCTVLYSVQLLFPEITTFYFFSEGISPMACN